MSGDDSDGSDGDDGDESDFSSDDEAVYFDEQYPGEAAGAQDDAIFTCCSPAELALALERDASLALHPAVAEMVAFFTENDAEGDEPAMAAIAEIREQAMAGAFAAYRIAALPYAAVGSPFRSGRHRPGRHMHGRVDVGPEV